MLVYTPVTAMKAQGQMRHSPLPKQWGRTWTLDKQGFNESDHRHDEGAAGGRSRQTPPLIYGGKFY